MDYTEANLSFLSEFGGDENNNLLQNSDGHVMFPNEFELFAPLLSFEFGSSSGSNQAIFHDSTLNQIQIQSGPTYRDLSNATPGNDRNLPPSPAAAASPFWWPTPQQGPSPSFTEELQSSRSDQPQSNQVCSDANVPGHIYVSYDPQTVAPNWRQSTPSILLNAPAIGTQQEHVTIQEHVDPELLCEPSSFNFYSDSSQNLVQSTGVSSQQLDPALASLKIGVPVFSPVISGPPLPYPPSGGLIQEFGPVESLLPEQGNNIFQLSQLNGDTGNALNHQLQQTHWDEPLNQYAEWPVYQPLQNIASSNIAPQGSLCQNSSSCHNSEEATNGMPYLINSQQSSQTSQNQKTSYQPTTLSGCHQLSSGHQINQAEGPSSKCDNPTETASASVFRPHASPATSSSMSTYQGLTLSRIQEYFKTQPNQVQSMPKEARLEKDNPSKSRRLSRRSQVESPGYQRSSGAPDRSSQGAQRQIKPSHTQSQQKIANRNRTVVPQLESTSNTFYQAHKERQKRKMLQREAVEAYKLAREHRKKGAEGKWTPASESRYKERQQPLKNNYSNSRQLSNALYDRKFEELNQPIDPFLRMSSAWVASKIEKDSASDNKDQQEQCSGN